MNAPVQNAPVAQPQVIVNIKFTPAGLELVIGALRKLPHEQVHELVEQTFGQYQQEIQRLQAEAVAAEEAAKAEAAAADRAAKKAAKGAPAAKGVPAKKTVTAKAVEDVTAKGDAGTDEDPLS